MLTQQTQAFLRGAIRSLLICTALVFSISGFVVISGIDSSHAAAKPKLNHKKITLETQTGTKLRVKNANKKVRWTIGSKKLVTVKKRTGKYEQSIVLKAGKKTGSTWVKAKIGKKTLKCKVTVRAAKPIKPVTPPDPGEPVAAPDPFDLAFSDFSFRLLQATLREDSPNPGGATAGSNVLISPDSVMTALTMTENGAAEQTLTDIHQVLAGTPAAVSQDPDAVTLQGLNRYLSELHSRLTGSKDLIYTLANSIWTKQNEIKINETFLQTNQTYHKASFHEGAFDEKTVSEMNQWVQDNTRNMIDRIIDPDQGLSRDARMVLINAIAFEGGWAEPFSDSQVLTKQTFTQTGGRKQSVTMLQGTEHTYLELAGGTGFCKLYSGGQIAFLGLLPPKGMDARTYANSLTGKAFLTAWKKAQSKSRTVHIKIPCFSYDYTASLKDVLIGMGMGRAFGNSADFQPMMAPDSPGFEEGLHIDDVLHKTHIELDQNGTKAAAVTAVIMEKNTAFPSQDPPKKVYLDRPFIYALADTRTGNPLFLGIVESIPEK